MVARAECKPTAVPHGDPALVQTLTQRLVANGIETTSSGDCPVVRVQVDQRGPQVHLRVTDAYERLGERDVQDIATAAAIIESWTLQEIEAGSGPVDEQAVGAPASSIGVRAAEAAAATGFAVSMRSAVADDASTWLGGSVSACVRIGWACAGATVRGAKDIEATGPTSSDHHSVLQIDTLATIEVPRRLGRFVVSPGADIGYAWQRITTPHVDIHMQPVTAVDSSHGLRAGLYVRGSRAVTDRFAIFAELAGDTSLIRSGITLGPATTLGISVGARIEIR